jgi:hypothetical protein
MRALMVATIDELMPLLRPMHEFDARRIISVNHDGCWFDLRRSKCHANSNAEAPRPAPFVVSGGNKLDSHRDVGIAP